MLFVGVFVMVAGGLRGVKTGTVFCVAVSFGGCICVCKWYPAKVGQRYGYGESGVFVL